MSSDNRMVSTQSSDTSSLVLTILGGLIAGVLFGIGLLVSGMANPAKVLNFLDVAGIWDPSLAFVMGGAVAVTVIGYPLIQRRDRPVITVGFELPTRNDIDRPLLTGALLFGVGWGIGGFCPGPAWVSLLGFAPGTVVFVACMLSGMWIVMRYKTRRIAGH